MKRFECDLIQLPVELIAFEGIFIPQESAVELRWETASEDKNEYFFVERSTDGTNWQTIQKVKGAGNSHTRQKYIYRDYDNFSAPVCYYRLMQWDYTGYKEHFKVIAVYTRESCTELDKTLSVYPNPATTRLHIDGLYAAEPVRLRLINALGQSVWQNAIREANTRIDLAGFPKGLYILQASVGEKFVTRKVIVR